MRIRIPTGLASIFFSIVLLVVGQGKSYADHAGIKILEDMEHALISLSNQVRPMVVSIAPYVPPASTKKQKDFNRRSRPTNAGAGVIIDGEKGLIVTNSHVVRNAGKVWVTVFGGEKFVGEILGTDEDTDLAIVKIPFSKPSLAPRFGDSGKLRIGQLVVAVGNPYGLKDTLTFGIISGLNRENVNLSRYEDFIQTDASINPGNSGGPLLNIQGEIIGINTAIINYAQNIGFAIPSNMVRQVTEQLLSFGEVRRGWLGVGIERVTPEHALAANTPEGEGVWINSVFEGDPADKAGLKGGDIILKIAGAPVKSPNGMIRLIGTITPGQTVKLDILRQGSQKVVSVKLGAQTKRRKLATSFPLDGGSPLGIEVRDLKPAERDLATVDGYGILVSKVYEGSHAQAKGLVAGDLIVAVNGENLTDEKQYTNILRSISSGEPVFLLVLRNDEKFHLALVRED